MKAERQHNESQQAETIQSKRERSHLSFEDNRSQTASQTKLIQSIQKKENKTSLPDNLKTGMENLSGFSMDHVSIHYNSNKPALLNALAYAQGTDIHVAFGQEKHLPHEAWHVVQQKQGRVRPTMQMQGVDVNDNEGLEREADRMGRLNHNQNIQTKKASYSFPNVNATVLQGVFPAVIGGIAGGLDLALNLFTIVKKIVKWAKGYKHYIIPENKELSADSTGEVTGYRVAQDNKRLSNGKLSIEFTSLHITDGLDFADSERTWLAAISSEATKIITSLAGLFSVTSILTDKYSSLKEDALERITAIIDSVTSILYAEANVHPIIDSLYHFIKEKLGGTSLGGSIGGVIGSVIGAIGGGIGGGILGSLAGAKGIATGAIGGAMAGAAVGGTVGKIVAPLVGKVANIFRRR